MLTEREFEIAIEENQKILTRIRASRKRGTRIPNPDVNHFLDVIQTRCSSSRRPTKEDVHHTFFKVWFFNNKDDDAPEPPYWCGLREENAEYLRTTKCYDTESYDSYDSYDSESEDN